MTGRLVLISFALAMVCGMIPHTYAFTAPFAVRIAPGAQRAGPQGSRPHNVGGVLGLVGIGQEQKNSRLKRIMKGEIDSSTRRLNEKAHA